MILDYLDWKYRVPPQQKQENIAGQMKDLLSRSIGYLISTNRR
jgi:hypothetical protein